MIRKFFIDEKNEAIKILNKGFSKNEFNSYEAYLIAKYFRSLGYGDQRTKTSLIMFCENHLEYFNYVKHMDDIQTILKSSRGDWIDKTTKIAVTKKELDSLKLVKNFNAQLVLLVFLLYAKRNNGYVYRNRWNDIKKILKLNITERELQHLLHLGYRNNLLRDSNENHFIKFIDKDSPVVFILDSEKSILDIKKKYIDHCGGIIYYCEICYKEITKTSNRKKYCEDCWREKHRERDRELKRKIRNTSVYD